MRDSTWAEGVPWMIEWAPVELLPTIPPTAALLDDALPTDHRRTSVLAHLEDPGLDPTTRSALATSSHLPSLFDTTLRAVVDSIVPADLSANAYL